MDNKDKYYTPDIKEFHIGQKVTILELSNYDSSVPDRSPVEAVIYNLDNSLNNKIYNDN